MWRRLFSLHLGSLRTALLAWCAARRDRGTFLVRMEDLTTGAAPVREREQLEDLATLDNLAGPGRLIVTFVIGYRELEFDIMGQEFGRRGKRIDEVIGVLRQAWTGEPFEYEGHTVAVHPVPATPGGRRIS